MSELLSSELIKLLRKEERRLKRRHGIRVMVQKMTANGVNILCNAWRPGLPMFQNRLDEHELVALVHEALRSLNVLGVRPLISVVQRRTMADAGKLVKTDPFHLQAAMRTAGVTELGSYGRAGIPSDEAARRIALLQQESKLANR